MKTKYGKDHCEPIVESVAMVRLPIVIVCIAMVSIAIVSIAIVSIQACASPPDPVYTPRLHVT